MRTLFQAQETKHKLLDGPEGAWELSSSPRGEGRGHLSPVVPFPGPPKPPPTEEAWEVLPPGVSERSASLLGPDLRGSGHGQLSFKPRETTSEASSNRSSLRAAAAQRRARSLFMSWKSAAKRDR